MLHGRHFGLVNREIQEFGHKSVLTGGRVKCEIEEYGHLYCPMSYGNFNSRLSFKIILQRHILDNQHTAWDK